MDSRVKEAVLDKIEESISNTSEVVAIMQMLDSLPFSDRDDFAFGIAIGRIYNSFHYQTRRVLKRNASADEFREFLEIIGQRADAIRTAFKQQ
jgi:hypothetical protein